MVVINRKTVFSSDRLYRYVLWREWGPELPFVQFIGLNPSIADEKVDDNTIKKCIKYSKEWGYGALCMTNLFAWRDTHPDEMKKVSSPIGVDNDKWLDMISQKADKVIACWGNDGGHRNRDFEVIKMMQVPLWHLGLSNLGKPKHPLFLKGNLQPVYWR